MEQDTDEALVVYSLPRKRRRTSGPDHATDELPATIGSSPQDVLPRAQDLDPKRLCLRPVISSRQTSEELAVCSSLINELPVEVLQHIMTFVDPFTLGRLMRVQKRFRALLDPQEPLPQSSGVVRRLPLLSQDALWLCSRTRFHPGLPSPLQTVTEYQMMRLLYSRKCQYCGKLPIPRPSNIARSPWNMGPGPDGLRTVWPFKVFSCAECLSTRMQKEQDFILSDSSAMQPGLPTACFTPSLHYIASATLRQSKVPAKLQLTKYYFMPQIEELQTQADNVRAIAGPAFKSWYKGLTPSLQEFMADVARLERWETLNANLSEAVPLGSSSVASSNYSEMQASSVAPSAITSTSHTVWQYRSAASHTDRATPYSAKGPLFQSQMMNPGSIQGTVSTNQATGGAGRSQQDALRVMHDRRADIERRAMQMSPHISPRDLTAMKSFNASIQIARPLNDDEWERLKPRMLAERLELDHSETLDNRSVTSFFPTRQTVIDQPSRSEVNQSSLPAVIERANRSTRDKIFEIGLEFVKRRRMDGHNLTEMNAPQFAVDVLQHVSHEFYAQQAREDAVLALEGRAPIGDSESGMRTRKLQLRHMRHVFDTCVKPYTDFVLKPLFACSGCEVNDKVFAFNALIQHYAAKHTTAFSKGTHVVHWSSEWPHENPPYRVNLDRPDTTPVASAQHLLRAPTSSIYSVHQDMAQAERILTHDDNHRRSVEEWSSNIPSLPRLAPPEPVTNHSSPDSIARSGVRPSSRYALHEYSLQASSPDQPAQHEYGPSRSSVRLMDQPRFVSHPQQYHRDLASQPSTDMAIVERSNSETYPEASIQRTPYSILVNVDHGSSDHVDRSGRYIDHYPRTRSYRRQYTEIGEQSQHFDPHHSTRAPNPSQARSSERAVEDFLDSLDPFAQSATTARSSGTPSRPRSREIGYSATAAMDRHASMSQARRSHYEAMPYDQRSGSFDSRADMMVVGMPPAPSPPSYRIDTRLQMRDAGSFDYPSRTHELWNTPLDIPRQIAETNTPQWPQVHGPRGSTQNLSPERVEVYNRGDASRYSTGGFTVHQMPAAVIEHDSYKSPQVLPPSPARTERYRDPHAQRYMLIEREQMPVDPRSAYVPDQRSRYLAESEPRYVPEDSNLERQHRPSGRSQDRYK